MQAKEQYIFLDTCGVALYRGLNEYLRSQSSYGTTPCKVSRFGIDADSSLLDLLLYQKLAH